MSSPLLATTTTTTTTINLNMAEWLARSIGSDCNIREGRLPHVSEERTLPQSLFPVRLHPHHAILEKQFHMWAKSFLGSSAKDIEQMQRRGIASLPCYLWPTTREPQRSLTLIKLMHWFTLVDEVVDEGAGLRGDVLEVERLCKGLIQALQLGSVTPMTSSASDQLYDPTPAPADIAAAANALHDVQAPLNIVHEYNKLAVQQLVVTVGCQWWGEVRRANMPREKEARLAGEVSHYLMAQVDITRFRENLLKSRAPPAGVEEYIISRRVASAFPLGLAMVEYDMSDRIHQLDEETLNSPILQQLRNAVSDQASWLNDIISFPKEFRQGDFLSLLPLLHIRNNIAHLRNPTSDEVVPFRVAVAQAWEMVAARERDCARMAYQILHSPHLATKPGLEEYVETVCGFTSGNWAWSIECPAYNIAHAEKKLAMGSASDLQVSPGRKLHGPSPTCSRAAPSQKMKTRVESAGAQDAQASSGRLRRLGKPSADAKCFAMSRCRQQTAPMMMMMKTGSREAPRLIKLHPSLLSTLI